MEFLLRRMRRTGDFPALSTTIGAVSKASASELEGVSGLASSILKDFDFTHKLLKLVNTAHFGRFGGTVSTISRAIMVMGFDRIRSMAVTLLLFEHLQNNTQADDLKDEVLSAYFSALIARLRILSELSTSLTQVIRDVPADKRAASVKVLAERFGKGLGITEQHLEGAVKNTVSEIIHDAGILNFRTDNSPLFNQARKWTTDANSQLEDTHDFEAALESARVEDATAAGQPATGAANGAARQAILSAGFSISLAPARDVFHAAISKGADIYIEDVESERIRDHIPAWYQQRIPARSLALFPIMIAKKPVGLIYGDANIAKSLCLGADDMTQLKTLRNQAVLAIKSQGT